MLSKKITVDPQTYFLCLGLFLLVTGIVVLYYVNAPFVEFGPDTPGYLSALHQLQTTGNPVNFFRLPTYPLFLLGVYTLTWQGNLMAASNIQGFLFICATGEISFLTFLITRKKWIAFLVGVLVGTNIFLLYNVKLIMTEGLSLWLFTTVMLNAILFVRNRRLLYFWISAVCLLFLLFARPEWVLFPCMLFPMLIFATWKKLPVRTVLLSAGSALLVIYLLVGSYIYVNARMNHVASLSSVTNMNLIGKVLQYHMQDESPYNPSLSRIYDTFAKEGRSPYYITGHVPGLGDNNAQVSADWAKEIILHHPGEFLAKSLPYLFTSLYVIPPLSIPQFHGLFAGMFQILLRIQIRLLLVNIFFPLCALVWIVLCCLRKTRHSFCVQATGILVLTIIYAIIITTLGGYTENDYARTHVVFDPVIALVVWGSLGLGLSQLRLRQKWLSFLHVGKRKEVGSLVPE